MDTAHADWIARCRALMESNRVAVGRYRYTRPAPSTYEHQWLWDSCFHAIILRHFDHDMARDELLSVVAHQAQDGADAGMIPHMAYWNGGGAGLWGRDDRSIITQPPLIAVAAWLVHQAQSDTALLTALYPALTAYHAWFDRRRDPDGDHLVALIHPWESGWDASPRWDAPMRLSADPTDDEARLARKDLVARLIAYDCDAAALAHDGYFYVESVDFNAIRAFDLLALADIADALSKADDAAGWRAKAGQVQAAITAKMLDDDGHLCDLDGLSERPITEPTAGEFVTLCGAGLSQSQAAGLAARLTHADYWPRYPVPTSPVSAALFRPDRYWRGNVWLQLNWLIWHGLRKYGFHAEADDLAQRSLALVAAQGFHEYFNPLTGAGHGSFPHSWSALVLDMLLVSR